MSRVLIISVGLMLMAINLTAVADRSLTSELSFVISGTNLDWPGDSMENIYKENEHYIPRNIIATRSQIYKNQAIIVFPRWKPGVPITLGVVNLRKTGTSGKPVVSPFPSWALQEGRNCRALQNAVDIVLDVHNTIWVLDVGNRAEESGAQCPPKVVAIDVITGRVLRSIDLGKWITRTSRLQYLAIDNTKDGRIFVYISDASTRAIIIYDVMESRGFQVILPDTVTRRNPNRDVLYISLVRKKSGSPVLYFTYLNSSHMYSIDVESLRSSAASTPITNIGPKHSQIVLLGNDDDGAIFFRKKGESDIFKWKVATKFTTENFILVQKGNNYRLPTHVVPGCKRHMWVLESNFQHYLDDTVCCKGPSVLLHPLFKPAKNL